jgi:hypothetical protein
MVIVLMVEAALIEMVQIDIVFVLTHLIPSALVDPLFDSYPNPLQELVTMMAMSNPMYYQH